MWFCSGLITYIQRHPSGFFLPPYNMFKVLSPVCLIATGNVEHYTSKVIMPRCSLHVSTGCGLGREEMTSSRGRARSLSVILLCTVCIGYKVTGCKNIAVITMEFQKITIKTCFSIVKISGKTISAIAIYRV